MNVNVTDTPASYTPGMRRLLPLLLVLTACTSNTVRVYDGPERPADELALLRPNPTSARVGFRRGPRSQNDSVSSATSGRRGWIFECVRCSDGGKLQRSTIAEAALR